MTDDAPSTTDAEAIESRLAAVERALTDGETDVDGLSDAAELAARVDELESTVDRLDDRVAELEAATRALRGYVGGVRAVNESVERRADAALAAVESLEDALRDGPDSALDAAGAGVLDGDSSAVGVRDGDADAVDTCDGRDSGSDAGAGRTDGDDRTPGGAPQGDSLAARLRNLP